MFRGFKVSLAHRNSMLFSYKDEGEEMVDTYSGDLLKSIKRLLLNENMLDGSKIQENWFKQIDAHVFISHSHNDLSQALSLAGWLYDKLGLTSFIDAIAWDYADKLLDDLIVSYKLTKKSEILYASKHVHMMLATAIQMMIDRTECLLFLNSPNSITVADSITKTTSPWIYYEIALSQYIRVKPLNEHRNIISKTAMLDEQMRLMLSYNVSLRHLPEISKVDFERVDSDGVMGTKALDVLYKNVDDGFKILNG